MFDREGFESWAVCQRDQHGLPYSVGRSEVTGQYVDGCTKKAWAAWVARCPAGFQVVPQELDIAMVEEFEERLTEQGWSSDAAGEIDKQDLWDAQLSVAPGPYKK